MFFLTYLRRELRRRMRQAVFVGLGLALGIGLVITVTAASAGVRNAQGTVLHSLYGVGTDITVTTSPKAGTGVPGPFGFRGSTGTQNRPAAGTKIDIDTLRGFGLGTISAASVHTVSRLHGVAAAAGGLALTDTKITGKIPAINSNSGGFGPGGGTGPGGGGTFRGNFTPTSFGVQGVDLANGELGPLSAGKLISGRTLRAADAHANVAVLDSGYATQNKLKTGSVITIAKTSFTVVGIVSEPSAQGGTAAYIPLARAQALSGMSGEVNTVYVSATSASQIGAVSREISKAIPSATVTTSSDLASEVTGSLANAASLADNLGKWLAIAVLVAAFGLASLLTMAAVSRRVREFGTLKALGWRGRRIVGQVMGESVAVGVIGGLAGVARGFGGAALIRALAPPLSATVGTTTGTATPGGVQQFAGPGGLGGSGGGAAFRRLAGNASHSVLVHLTAPVTLGAVLLAVVLAIAGGLIAGSLGGWRAARMRPAAAMARVA